MSVKISALPLATQANAGDAFEAAQSGTSRQVSGTQLSALIDALAHTFTQQANWGLGAQITLNPSGTGQFATGDIVLGSDSSASFAALRFLIGTLGNVSQAITALTPSAGTTYIADLSKPTQTITTNAAIDLTTSSNRPAAGLYTSTTIRYNTSGSVRALTWNASWVTLGFALPATLAANKVLIVTLAAWGPNETDIIAAWNIQA